MEFRDTLAFWDDKVCVIYLKTKHNNECFVQMMMVSFYEGFSTGINAKYVEADYHQCIIMDLCLFLYKNNFLVLHKRKKKISLLQCQVTFHKRIICIL